MRYSDKYIVWAGITLTLLALSLPYHVLAQESDVFTDENIYRYNALENKNSQVILFDISRGDLAVADVVTVKQDEKISDEVDEIIKKQEYLQEQVDRLINKIEDGSDIGKFLIGTKLGMLRFQLVQIKDHVYRLKQLDAKASDVSDKVKIESEIGFANETKTRLENFIGAQEQKFSLLGWFTGVL